MNKQQLADKAVEKLLRNDAFSEWLGVKLLDLKPGNVKIEMTIRKEMLNGFFPMPCSPIDAACSHGAHQHAGCEAPKYHVLEARR